MSDSTPTSLINVVLFVVAVVCLGRTSLLGCVRARVHVSSLSSLSENVPFTFRVVSFDFFSSTINRAFAFNAIGSVVYPLFLVFFSLSELFHFQLWQNLNIEDVFVGAVVIRRMSE